MSIKPKFILASSSPQRKALLSSIDIVPDEIIPADIDETPAKGELPRPYAQRMAREKAQKVASLCQGTYCLLAADTVIAVGRRVLPKATSPELAAFCISHLSGRRHNVYTAVTLVEQTTLGEQRIAHRCAHTVVSFARMSPSQQKWLLDAGDWEGKSGGYALQGHASRFIRFVRGAPSTVIGLPIFDTAQMLRGLQNNPFGL